MCNLLSTLSMTFIYSFSCGYKLKQLLQASCLIKDLKEKACFFASGLSFLLQLYPLNILNKNLPFLEDEIHG